MMSGLFGYELSNLGAKRSTMCTKNSQSFPVNFSCYHLTASAQATAPSDTTVKVLALIFQDNSVSYRRDQDHDVSPSAREKKHTPTKAGVP